MMGVIKIEKSSPPGLDFHHPLKEDEIEIYSLLIIGEENLN